MKKGWDFFKEQFWTIYHSPTAFRGWKALLTGLKIGTLMSGTHALVLLCFGFIVLLCHEERSFRELFSEGTFGHLLVLSAMGGLFISISFAAIGHMAGMFDGVRFRGYFDQIVVTGISPLRYLSGQFLSGTATFLLMSLSMIPYFVFGETLGFGGWLWFSYGIFLIFFWGIVLMFLVSALTVFFHEVLSAFLTIAFAFGFGFLSLTPVPGLWGGITPIRYLVQPVISNLAGTGNTRDAGIFETFYKYAFLGYWKIPIFLYTPLVYIFIIGICYRILYVGPRHLLLPGSNNLGVVSFPGDFKKRGFWRLRWNLKRQIDRFFFFENSATQFSPEEKEQYRRNTRFLMINMFILLFVLGLTGRYWQYFPKTTMGSPSTRDIFEIRSLLLCIFFWPIYYFFSIRARNEFVITKKIWKNAWDHYFEFVYYFFLPLLLLPLIILATPYCSQLFLGSSSYYTNFNDYLEILLGTFLIFPYLWSIHLFGRLIATYTYSKVIVSIFMVFYIFLTNLLIFLFTVFLQEFFSLRFQEELFNPLFPVVPENISQDRLTIEAVGVAMLFLLLDITLIQFIQRRIKRIHKNLE
ncbi:MAG: hypothetical protein AABZ60_09530 [Planctomycetota bacterium]